MNKSNAFWMKGTEFLGSYELNFCVSYFKKQIRFVSMKNRNFVSLLSKVSLFIVTLIQSLLFSASK